MIQSFKRALRLTALALTFSAGCSTSDATLEPLARQPAVVQSGDHEYTLVEGALPLGLPSVQVFQLIGVAGGSLSVAGHTITVPAGAVRLPTLFIMTLGTGGFVDVELTAVHVVFGQRFDIGSRGFANGATVKLTLSYAWATNVADPSQLRIVRKLGGSNVEILETRINADAQVIETELEHFSGYAMAM